MDIRDGASIYHLRLHGYATNHLYYKAIQGHNISLVKYIGKFVKSQQATTADVARVLNHFEKKFSLVESMLELENQFLALKKVSMSDDEYTSAFTDKMKFSM